MASDDSSFSAKTARILSFRRGARGLPTGQPRRGPPRDSVQDLAQYERGPNDRGNAPGEYRHRMLVNAAAFLFVIALIAAGFWLADTMARMRKNQDCVLSGRRGCTPVDVVPKDRW